MRKMRYYFVILRNGSPSLVLHSHIAAAGILAENAEMLMTPRPGRQKRTLLHDKFDDTLLGLAEGTKVGLAVVAWPILQEFHWGCSAVAVLLAGRPRIRPRKVVLTLAYSGSRIALLPVSEFRFANACVGTASGPMSAPTADTSGASIGMSLSIAQSTTSSESLAFEVFGST